MNLLVAAYAASSLLMFLSPILLGVFLARKLGLTWRLFIFGGLAFILAQLIHLPLNAVLTRVAPGLGAEGNIWVQALALGFTAALTEELARYSILRNNLKDARSWKSALMYGAGHGGFEAMILGILSALTLVNMIALKNNPDMLASLPAERLEMVRQQMTTFWSLPWHLALMGAVERVSALTIQISLAVLVMQVFLRKNSNWLWLAMAWHWFVDTASVLSVSRFSIPITELIIGVFAITSLMIIFYFRPQKPEDDHAPPQEPSEHLSLETLDFNASTAQLDEYRHSET